MAVDYLIYTFVVVENNNQSYPIPLIILLLVLVILAILYLFKRKNVFLFTFSDKHHIPAIIFNCDGKIGEIDKLVSQIDLMPTLFGCLNWNYQTEFYGKDIAKIYPSEEKAFIGNYRTLGLLKDSIFTELNDKEKVTQYYWNSTNKIMTEFEGKQIDSLKNLTIAYYQTASERFKKGNMKQPEK